jgi:adenylate kinase
MRIVLLGPPASGKGTQGRRLSAQLDLEYLSTGALLREAVENRTKLGIAAEPVLERGGYVPDELICPILGEWLEQHDAGTGWVLDGFPRTLNQATFLDDWLSARNSTLDVAVALEAPLSELLERIRDRVECPDCRWSGKRDELTDSEECPKCGGEAAARTDDDEDNFRNRHLEFVSNTLPAIDFYRETGRLITVSATGTRDQTAAAILQGIKSAPH